MNKNIINGLELANSIKLNIRKDITSNNYIPNLAVILVGEDPASKLYIKLKEKACNEVGVIFHKYFLSENTTEKELIELIDFLNNDEEIDAILIQLPLPSKFNEEKIIARIKKEKDVDGFGPENIKDFMNNKAIIVPGLANGIYELIKSTNINLENKKTLVIANSKVFAKPILKMMENKKSIATFITPNDHDLIAKTKEVDIIIIAIGKKWFLTKDMVKKESIIIDVGINTIKNKTFGDVNPNVDELDVYRSPVPGGVGPMTIAMLLLNTLELYKLNKK